MRRYAPSRLDLTVGRLLSISRVSWSATYGASKGVRFVFDADIVPQGELRGGIRLQEAELEDWAPIGPGCGEPLTVECRAGAESPNNHLSVSLPESFFAIRSNAVKSPAGE